MHSLDLMHQGYGYLQGMSMLGPPSAHTGMQNVGLIRVKTGDKQQANLVKFPLTGTGTAKILKVKKSLHLQQVTTFIGNGCII